MPTETKSLADLQLECALAETECPCIGSSNSCDGCHRAYAHSLSDCTRCAGTGKIGLVPGLRLKCPICSTYKPDPKRPQNSDGFAMKAYHKPNEWSICLGRGWIPETRLSNAMVAAQKVEIYIEIIPSIHGFRAYRSLPDVQVYKWSLEDYKSTPDLAFWSALDKVV